MKRAAKPLGASAAVKYDVVLYFLAVLVAVMPPRK